MPVSNRRLRLAGRRARRSGFTMIELLSALLVLMTLMNVSLPLYLSSAMDSQVKACRANMQTIGDAEQAYRNANPSHQFTTVLSNLNGNLGAVPVCPAGGTYSVAISNGSGHSNGMTIPSGFIIVSCNGASGSATHGTFAPGFDSE